MDYRTYRLDKRAQSRTGRETAKVKDHIRHLEVSLRDHTFDGHDPMLVFSFLADLVEECNTLQISEAQAYLELPYLLKGTAKEQFKAVRSLAQKERGRGQLLARVCAVSAPNVREVASH